MNRRHFLGAAAGAALAQAPAVEIIDIHQHTDYSGRPDDVLLKHQDLMGITKTILLPSGRVYGLEAGASGNDRCMEVAKRYPKKYVTFANEVPYHPEAKQTLEKYLNQGAIGIGEQKFFVDVLSAPMNLICDIAQHFSVPILLHFQYERYNVNFGQFYQVLKKYPKVNFIGHAQTWWANIDANQTKEPSVLYPKGRVTAGGWTDRYLQDYPNMYADLSAGSGLNAMQRDEEHARAFINRNQDKLLYGSDCSDHVGQGPKCSGSQQIAKIKKLATPEIQRKIFSENVKKIVRLG
ncbi:MAG: amidohydrolase family protein [Bryobacterales bacterium]|nr:amidohydrolase family protein [Bryobacterales bacterium]